MGMEVEKESEREIWKGRVRDGQRRKINSDAQAREIKREEDKTRQREGKRKREIERCRERS